MESYCVIQFKDKQEKLLVSNLLATHTDVDFKMENDLKKFVAEKFNVKITDHIEMKDQSTNTCQENETEQIKTEIVDQDVVSNVVQPTTEIGNKEKEVKKEVVIDIAEVIVPNDGVTIDHPAEDVSSHIINVAPPIINTLQNGQHSTQSFSVPDSIVADQPIPDIDNTQNFMSMDDYGTHVPYLERPVEPNEEIGDDTAAVIDTENYQDITAMHEVLEDVGVEEEKEIMIGNGNDEGLIGSVAVDNMPVDDVLMPNQVDIPTSSMKKRSCRSAKKILEEIDEHKRKTTECNKCGSKLRDIYTKKMDHVINVHTDTMRFKCLVDGCETKCKTQGNMVSHMKRKHKNQLNAFTNIELTSEQNVETYSMMKECFDEGDSADKCQMCNQSVGGNCRNSSNWKKDHALDHIDFMLYKCMEDGCSFASKTTHSMKLHVSHAHPKIANPTLTKIKLTKKQELEIEKMLIKCFPNLDKDGSTT